MLRKLTAKQFAGWEHFAQLEPFGEFRADYRAALIAQTIANVHRGTRESYSIEDFKLQFDDQTGKNKQTPEFQLVIARAIAAGYSATDKTL